MANLGLTFEDLYKRVSDFLGLDTSPTGDNLTLVKQYVNDGYAQFLMGIDPRTNRAHGWSFLFPESNITLWADSTGTGGTENEGTGLTFTAQSATFYNSMVGHTIYIPVSGTTTGYTIDSYLTSTSVLLGTTGPAGVTGTTFNISSNNLYSLPSDFATIVDDPTYSSELYRTSLHRTSVQQVRELLSGISSYSADPTHYAVQPRDFSAIDGQRWELIVYPEPNNTRTLNYRYKLLASKLENTYDYPLGGPEHAQTILESSMAIAEQRSDDTMGLHTQKYQQLMAASIDLDSQNRAKNIGYNGDGASLFDHDRLGIATMSTNSVG